LNIQVGELSGVSVSLRNLVTIGVLIAMRRRDRGSCLSEFPRSIAFLIASLVVVTGPTVVTPLQLVGSSDEARFEGRHFDPVGAITAVIAIVLSGNVEPLILLKGCCWVGNWHRDRIGCGWFTKPLLKQSNFCPRN